MSQAVTLTAGAYTVSFRVAQRGNWNPGGAQTVEVVIDGYVVGTYTPGSTAYETYTTAAFTVTAGAHAITLRGTRSGDSTAFVDDVRIVAANSGQVVVQAAGDWDWDRDDDVNGVWVG
jgi:hypothetical protein